MQYTSRWLAERAISVDLLPTKINNLSNPYTDLRNLDAIQDRKLDRHIVFDMSTQDALTAILSKVIDSVANSTEFSWFYKLYAFLCSLAKYADFFLILQTFP